MCDVQYTETKNPIPYLTVLTVTQVGPDLGEHEWRGTNLLACTHSSSAHFPVTGSSMMILDGEGIKDKDLNGLLVLLQSTQSIPYFWFFHPTVGHLWVLQR